uniref:Uncharacterized protein n=1 Tax=Pipistrellus kuhlii TaxID=59472 RepID=A0A7J7Y944_PIPKU|nr:hypothetical protein mPipKuh1_010300 [Pipistrellus kuhlii]
MELIYCGLFLHPFVSTHTLHLTLSSCTHQFIGQKSKQNVFSNYTIPALGESVLWGRHLRSWQDRGAAGRTRWSRGRDLGEGAWETAVGTEGSFLQGHLNFCTVTVKPGQTEGVCPPGHTTRTWTPIGPEIRKIIVLEDA